MEFGYITLLSPPLLPEPLCGIREIFSNSNRVIGTYFIVLLIFPPLKFFIAKIARASEFSLPNMQEQLFYH